MGFIRVFSALLALSFIVLPQSALSAPKRKKKPTATAKATLEVYPAMEEVVIDEGEVTEIEGMRATPSTSISSLDAQAKTKALEERMALLERKIATPSAEAPKPAVARASSAEEFYVVPAGKADQLAGRLKLVEAILRESGRAYDYRTLTTRQLETELKKIRANKPTADELKILLAE